MAFILYLLIVATVRLNAQEVPQPEDGNSTAPGPVRICEVCTCSEIRSEDEVAEIVQNIQCSELDRIEEIPDLNRIMWPGNVNRLKISATFEGIGLTTVESLPANNLIETLSFTNNLIKTTWPEAFGDLPGLRKLSFSQNKFSEITQDMFTKLGNLEQLDLSYNQLTEFNKLDFVELKNLKKLNLQSNQIKDLLLEAFDENDKLEDLDLSKNLIVNIKLKNESKLLKTLKRLNLSGNNITRVLVGNFPENSIELLDLSNNAITNIEDSAFAQCTHLRELNLASNQIASSFTVPVSTLSVTLAHNRLRDWPKFPPVIRHIDLSSNELYDLYDQNDVEFDQLEILKLSSNQLTKFELTTRLLKLSTLDISYNFLPQIPTSVSSEMLPALAELRLDGNPIKTIYFPEKVSARWVYLNDLREITRIDEKSVENLCARSEPEMNECIQLHVSNCPRLEEVSEGAFNETPICLLDLSYNNLTELPEQLLDWARLREGLNLQGNPWDCSCHMQWMLDSLLPRIHQNYPQFLTELRCETPRARQGLRMVHWLNWGERVLCSDGYRTGPNQSYRLEPRNSTGIIPGVSNLTLILGGCVILGLVIVVGLTTYLIRQRNKTYRVRRAAAVAAARRRQSSQDKNGNAEQFKALNRA